MSNTEFWAKCQELGIPSMYVRWEGSGDEGGINQVYATSKDGKTIDIMSDHEDIVDFLDEMVNDHTDLCGDNEGMAADINIDVAEKRVRVTPIYHQEGDTSTLALEDD